MHQFPGEKKRAAEVQEKLADAFNLAEALFNFWLTAEKDEWIAKSTLPTAGIHLSMMLDVQALRLFRSVIEQCRRCEGFNASILARSLYESVLGVGFLLVEDLRIIVEPIVSRGPPAAASPTASGYRAKFRSKGVKRTAKHRLSRELRANLYYAHSLFQDQERGLEILERVPRYKKKVKELKKTIDIALIAEKDKEIGPEWSYILRHHPHTYSGLSVADLARVLDQSLSWWQQIIYPFQSRAVHANDPLKHIEISAEHRMRASFLSTNSQVYESLRTAITMFFVHIRILHENIGFGTDVDIAYSSLKRKFDQLSWAGE